MWQHDHTPLFPAVCRAIRHYFDRVQEFFQLLMRELFDANFGMFRMDPERRTYWFRASSLELDMEFELVGLLLALAIYNNHILEVSFPMVVYK